MSVFGYTLFAVAMGLQALLTLRGSAARVPVRLSRGVLVSAVIALTECLLLLLGMWFASLWNYQLSRINTYTFLGIMLLLVAKMLLAAYGRQRREAAYDISQAATVVLLAVALGIDALIGGIAFGFLDEVAAGGHKAGIPLFTAVFLLSYLGIMLGRSKVEVKQQRWQLFSVLFVLVTVFIALQHSL